MHQILLYQDDQLHVIGSQVHCVPGSLCPRFYVCNFYVTFFATFLQLFFSFKKVAFLGHFLQLVLQLLCNFLLQKKKLLKVAKKLPKKLHKKKLQQTCKKLPQKLHTSCKHIEPRTQWTQDAKTCFQDDLQTETVVFCILCAYA